MFPWSFGTNCSADTENLKWILIPFPLYTLSNQHRLGKQKFLFYSCRYTFCQAICMYHHDSHFDSLTSPFELIFLQFSPAGAAKLDDGKLYLASFGLKGHFDSVKLF